MLLNKLGSIERPSLRELFTSYILLGKVKASGLSVQKKQVSMRLGAA